MALTDEDKAWIKGQLEQVVQQVNEQVDVRIERVETAILTEFHKWASPFEARMRSHSAAIRAFDEELVSVSERVKKLEGRA